MKRYDKNTTLPVEADVGGYLRATANYEDRESATVTKTAAAATDEPVVGIPHINRGPEFVDQDPTDRTVNENSAEAALVGDAVETVAADKGERWSQRRESNPWPAVYETAALPLSYAGFNCGPIRPHNPYYRHESALCKSAEPLGPTRLDILKGEAIISANGLLSASPHWRHHGSDTCKHTSTLNGGDFCPGCRGRIGRHIYPRR